MTGKISKSWTNIYSWILESIFWSFHRKSSWNLNFLSQYLQLNVFSTVWNLSCIFNSCEVMKFLSQYLQVKGFSPLCLLSWIFNLLDCVNFLSQSLQAKGFSPVWILSCIFTSCEVLNFLLQYLQAKGFSFSALLCKITNHDSSFIKLENVIPQKFINHCASVSYCS